MRTYGIYLAIAFLVLLLAFFEPVSSAYLRFDRELIDAGEIWRLFSAHFVHLSYTHMVGNLLAVFLVAYISGESLNNLTLAAVYDKRGQAILDKGESIKLRTLAMRRQVYFDKQSKNLNLMN
mgnify:CR=1 FL=1